ncbi:MAG: lipocalin-like domain-containing protein [Muribaculum sp.]|nr:lipocalin-like domain-containing protein [Muribaculaceae bacterium]MCM1081182.1 lipocalin-like domain-containing protein [Muribaculum sp.]
MKKITLVILSILLFTAISGCTHNDGDIGPLFGSWQMTEITVDGQPVADYNQNVFWMFQNSVVCLREILPHHEADNRWGQWRWADKNTLLLNFDHHDELHQPDDPVYLPLPITGLDAGDNLLHVDRLTSTRMTLTRGNYTYRLRKP